MLNNAEHINDEKNPWYSPSRESQSCWEEGRAGRARALYSNTTEFEMIWLLAATWRVTRPVSWAVKSTRIKITNHVRTVNGYMPWWKHAVCPCEWHTWAVTAQHARLNERRWHCDLIKQTGVFTAGLLPRPCYEHLHSALKHKTCTQALFRDNGNSNVII